MHEHTRGFGHGPHRQRDHSLLAVRMIEPALLVFLSQKEQHGYTLLEQLEKIGLGTVHPSLIYRVLREMEESGWVTSIWEKEQTQGPPRRVYRLTEDGQAALHQWENQLLQIKALITDLINQVKTPPLT